MSLSPYAKSLLLFLLPMALMFSFYALWSHPEINKSLISFLEGDFEAKSLFIMKFKLTLTTIVLCALIIGIIKRFDWRLILLLACLFLILANESLWDLIAWEKNFKYDSNAGIAAIPILILVFIWQSVLAMVFVWRYTKK